MMRTLREVADVDSVVAQGDDPSKHHSPPNGNFLGRMVRVIGDL
jgi:hypothetical protein